MTSRNFCVKNKTNFTNKLRRTNWILLFSLHDADSVFNHFIKKLKFKFNKPFPYEPVNNTIKPPPPPPADSSLQGIINDFCAKYTAWCMLNCIVINANKSNFLST